METHLTPERLAEIKAYCEKATAGPWADDQHANEVVTSPIDGKHRILLKPQSLHVSVAERDANRCFVANARTDLPAAVEEITRLRAEVETAMQTAAACAKDAGILRQQLDNAVAQIGKEHHGATRLCCQLREQARAEADTLRQQLAAAEAMPAQLLDVHAICDQRDKAVQERDELRQQLAEAEGELASQRRALESADKLIDEHKADNAYLHQQLQQANAASGEDTKRLDKLERDGALLVRVYKDGRVLFTKPYGHGFSLRIAIDNYAAMEGSRTK